MLQPDSDITKPVRRCARMNNERDIDAETLAVSKEDKEDTRNIVTKRWESSKGHCLGVRRKKRWSRGDAFAGELFHHTGVVAVTTIQQQGKHISLLLPSSRKSRLASIVARACLSCGVVIVVVVAVLCTCC